MWKSLKSTHSMKEFIPQHLGFTLIELLIVVAIIGILAAIAIPNFLQAQTRAKVARAMTDIRTMATALETYRTDNNDYPNGQGETRDPGKVWTPSLNWNRFSVLTSPVDYMASLPANAPFGAWTSEWIGAIEGYFYWGGAYFRGPFSHGPYVHPSYADGQYMMFCEGPSRQYSNNPSLGTDYLTAYDPTNGTISVGAIIYVNASSHYHSFN